MPDLRRHEGLVHMLDRESDPWFVAADVCRALDIRNPTMALRALDTDEKGVANSDTLGGSQPLTIISEPGLYKLIARSRKPEAKRFDRWVRHEVLPAVRKTGSFVMTGEDGERIRCTDGISRMLSHKVTGLESALALLTEQVRAMVIVSDPRRSRAR